MEEQAKTISYWKEWISEMQESGQLGYSISEHIN